MKTKAVGIPDNALQRIRKGLELVVDGPRGTARRTGLGAFKVAGKTGTPQVTSGSRGKNHAWFAGYAPKDNPVISFAVIVPYVPHGIHGADVAAPVIRDFLADPRVRSRLSRTAR